MYTIDKNWSIVKPQDAIPSEDYAAEELQRYLNEVSDILLPVIVESALPLENAIYIGNCKKVSGIVDFNELEPEGFFIKTFENNLAIAGSRPRGTLYGVYTFLEDYLGCRWFGTTASHIPKGNRITFPALDVKTAPKLFYREVFYTEAFDGDWAAKHKLNGQHHRVAEKHGGKIMYSKRFVHTFEQLVPPEEYGEKHPEYFSLIDGNRMLKEAQLCLTNPEVYEIALARLKQWIEEEPEATIFSVSQNDYKNPCQCESCRKIDDEEESHSGTLLRFVNRLAEKIEEAYPDKYIDTLAYLHTRKAPAKTRPRKNVIIRLCDIECCFLHPLNDPACSGNNAFAADLKAWSKLTGKLFVWDYTVNFNHYLSPFPNFNVLQKNTRFFIENHVVSLFEQGNYCESGKGEFSELKAYVLAKLLWDPDCDVEKVIDEFIEAYYKESHFYVKQYFTLINSRANDIEDFHLGIFDVPDRRFFTPEFLHKCNETLKNALASAACDEVRNRVKLVEMQIRYVELFLMPREDKTRNKAIENFFQEIEKLGISRISEWFSRQQSKEMFLEYKYGKGWSAAPIPAD